ncbi:hypothetical protein HMF3257_27170 [Spirosoma telluris]|uniref:Ankyrin repeat domain-containing protein n=2 Tax=Spirosoma telluris TaxID=2183553 RepID=A0A327NNY5_9BACT|nr:hypothetical protein HMF3257_27170 [Spirosoma telluris]
MVVAAVVFSLTNRLLHLHFPIWVLAIAAAILVFVIMSTFLSNSSNDPTLYYIMTVVINVIVVLLMITLTGISNFIFSAHFSTPFAFGKPQLITTIIYAIITVFFAVQPLISDAKGYIGDIQSEKKLRTIKEIIDTGNIDDFIEVSDSNFELWKVRLINEQRSLLEYVVAQDKVAMAHVLLNGHKDLFKYTFSWDIKSQSMVEMLIEDGMSPDQAIQALTAYNKTELVKIVVEKYHPKFSSSVSYITKNVMHYKNDELLNYLVEKGLGKDLIQSNETLYGLGEKNDTTAVYQLMKKGFAVDPTDNRLIYWAIYNNNLPFLKVLFTYPFNVNASSDEYTNLENAIVGGHKEIVDFLLTLKPDIETLHTTKLNGETNALLLAERYKQTEMLEKLKRYIGQN